MPGQAGGYRKDRLHIADVPITKETIMATETNTHEAEETNPKCPNCGSENISYDNGMAICMDCMLEWPVE